MSEPDILKSYEENLTGGYEHQTLHVLEHEENGTEIVMFMMDAEYDPVRVTFNAEGFATIHADSYKWHTFSADDLEFIADQAREAEEIWERIFDEDEKELGSKN